ncbi:formyl-coenzyme A transferase [Nadsonia fulvescens var. elongata DSM 6958]|uniref:Formyl-coenzyme A transferase n=1 Tax=Nadsonia fulvescens var. elongata DSM 6958 TaxID=857566 RepID=A0A1E3PER8_9ASCO|nr:formyl-coenzyme A transferase [Nadsonia fulvescens var. elongata DSM 6958]
MLKSSLVRSSQLLKTIACHKSSYSIKAKAPLPLTGVKILDLTRVLAGPYASQMLGDLGADVIKVEHPERGDDTRAWGPPFANYSQEVTGSQYPGESAYFLCANRNKRSIGLDFKKEEGQKILLQLLEESDVLMENFIPGTLEKYGLSYNQLNSDPKFKHLIYASITGYGQTGPYINRAGYDVMVEAEYGLMHITGEKNGPPVKVGVAVTDLITGITTANSILAALIQRNNTKEKGKKGEGQWLDVALVDCQLASLANIASNVLIDPKANPGRWGTEHPSICPYQAFPTKNGNIMIGGGNDRLFNKLNILLEKSEWNLDPRFTTNTLRVKNRDILVPMIKKVLLTKTTDEWLKIFENSGFAYAAINDVRTALQSDHVASRNLVHTIKHPECGDIKLIGNPVKYSGMDLGIRLAPPTLGQHTHEILSEFGFENEKIKQLKDSGVVNK